jgi:hypothetical protein
MLSTMLSPTTTLLAFLTLCCIAGLICLFRIASNLITFFRANGRSASYVAIDRYSECEKGCIETVALLETLEDEKKEVRCSAQPEPEKSADEPISQEMIVCWETRSVCKVKKGSKKPVPRISQSEEIPSTHDDPAHMDNGRKSKRSTRKETFDGVDFGSMGTKGVRVVREDAEMSMGNEGDERN